MNKADRPMANPVVVLREEFDDWAVLFNPDNAAAVGVNPVGVAVWKLLDGKNSLDKIVSSVEDAFDGTPDDSATDIESFIDSLVEQGFVSCGKVNGRRGSDG